MLGKIEGVLYGGAISGALNGELSLPNEFKKEVDFVNKRSFKALSQVAYTTMTLILKNDKVKFESRINRIDF